MNYAREYEERLRQGALTTPSRYPTFKLELKPDGARLKQRATHYRIKLVVPLEDTTDATYWYRDTMAEAEALKAELAEALSECEHRLYIYADTPHGHLRVR